MQQVSSLILLNWNVSINEVVQQIMIAVDIPT
jgi:hypothetical protein